MQRFLQTKVSIRIETNENGQENPFSFPFLFFFCGNGIRFEKARIKNEIGLREARTKNEIDIIT
jgi:hypothetical protein